MLRSSPGFLKRGSVHTRTPDCRMSSANTTRRRPKWPKSSVSLRPVGWSILWAVVAARVRSISLRSERPSMAPRPERFRSCPHVCASLASSLSISDPMICSPTSANAATLRVLQFFAVSLRPMITPPPLRSLVNRSRTAHRSSISIWTKACSTQRRRW